ncbi:MAG TPA: glycosyl hydrolase family 28-related protein [bacterium]|nr:glycosyl hydrolase family 28-related protein [bacterium]HPN44562.1 glycosyl hydrolase family 28-related protein [bacterium]
MFKNKQYKWVILLLVTILAALNNSCRLPLFNSRPSLYTTAFYDAGAVYFTPDRFTIHADGETDDSAALQNAIDQLEKTWGAGIVFIPEGKYCLDNTVNIWRGIRLIGYGKRKPVFIVRENHPAYLYEKKIVLHFRDNYPLPGQAPEDAGSSSFGSGMSNLALHIAPGNPGAIAVRFNVAQLSALQHIDFELESGYTAIEQLGNLVEDCTFTGGDYGIITDTSPTGRQVMVMDCRFSNQKEAAVLCGESGMTLIRSQFKNTQHAVFVRENAIEKLFVRDCRCENISRSAFLISRYNSQRNQINMLNVLCNRVPNFLHFQDRNAPVDIDQLYYVIEYLNHGLLIQRMLSDSYDKLIKTMYKFQPLKEPVKMVKSTAPHLPAQKKWFTITEYGAKGDGFTDDTIAFITAINDNETIYVPSGRYVISKPLQLRKETNLVGLHPFATQIVLRDSTAGFTNPDSLTPMITTPPGGENIISGIGFDAGNNRGAVQIQWQAGAKSCLDDVWFGWGAEGGQIVEPGKGYSLWVTNEGGGILKNIWTANMNMQAGVLVNNTQTPGKVYLLSSQHHLAQEVILENVRNWSFYALYTEGSKDSAAIHAITMQNCLDMEFNNLFVCHQLTQSSGDAAALRLLNCDNITIRGVHNFSSGRSPFAGTIYIADRDFYIPDKELAFLHLKKF